MSEGIERVTFPAVIDEHGDIKPESVNQTRGRLARFVPKVGRRVTVTVSRYVKSKTNPQLATYWGPVLEAWADYTGYTHDEMDTELRLAYLAPQLAISRLTGEETTERPRLRDLSSKEMSEFLDRVIREGHMLGIHFRLDRAS